MDRTSTDEDIFIAQQKNRRIACRCNSKKEKHCSSIEQSADGSVLFRFSDEPPAKEVTATATPTPTPTPAATPATPVESESMSEDNKLVQQAVIIGAGRVGSALAQMGNGNDLVRTLEHSPFSFLSHSGQSCRY